MDSIIKVQGGIGDMVSYLTRIPSYKRIKNINKVYFNQVSGWRDVPLLIIEILQPCISNGYINGIILGQVNSELPCLIEDWRPDNSSLSYPMQLPFIMPTYQSDEINIPQLYNKKICCINPVTASGNFKGYTEYRYLPKYDWIEICKHLKKLGYYIIYIGGSSDKGYIPQEYIDLDLAGLIPIRQTVSILKKCHLCVCTNSWPGEVTSYAGIPTVYLYYTNKHWIPLHFPKYELPNCGIPNLRIELDKKLENIIKYIDELSQ
jgi:hypothetical protein